ncbi:tetratricopeptide repeat protein [Paludicola sp. MB14-C6]|uniref:tetratricopeptide repeat protein n=1 Tax=Paludihabitans sp. MB14-C6 TaxID=3070656 RepID=UPI0027DE7325|nr:tetratricopeptide repeat protein [Paludicola sp. MB14-C6]WMJ24050.1 tetratricopeptide repeat protein [Paludicola sp. MB14-C6]
MNNIDHLNIVLKKLIKEPNNAQYYNDVGVLLYQLKDFENAYQYLNKAYEHSPCNANILYHYALILETQNKLENALLLYKEYYKRYSNETFVIEKIQELSYRLGIYDTAQLNKKGAF